MKIRKKIQVLALLAISIFTFCNYVVFSKESETVASKAQVLVRKGSVCFENGDFKETIRWSRLALQVAPEKVEGHFLIAAAQLKLGNLRESVKYSNNCIRLNPKFPIPYFYKGLAESRLHQGNPISDLDTCIRLAPKFAGAYELKARILKEKGLREEATALAKQALHAGCHSDYLNELALAH